MQDFFFASIDDPSNNESCVRVIVHLAMDGYQQAIHTSYAESMFCSFRHKFSASLQDSLEEHSSKRLID